MASIEESWTNVYLRAMETTPLQQLQNSTNAWWRNTTDSTTLDTNITYPEIYRQYATEMIEQLDRRSALYYLNALGLAQHLSPTQDFKEMFAWLG